MSNEDRTPSKGDRVKIVGHSGIFEVIKVHDNCLFIDLKHLDLPGPDYIEKYVLWTELVYLDPVPSPESVAETASS